MGTLRDGFSGMASVIVLPLDTSRASHLVRITFDEPGGAVSNDG